MASEASGELMFTTSTNYIAVVAIDFGTTYSGFAFAFNHKEGEGGIHMNRAWGYDYGFTTLKTPTSLLLCPNGDFDSFGYEADDKYVNFVCGEEKEYYYFKHFKMRLHTSKNLDRDTKLTARNGKQMDALVVFSHSIRYLKDAAIEIIRERTGDDEFNSNDIQWVITVPAIWQPAAKQFMREAAYQAGVASRDNPDQLMIALEPEAASVYCRERKMRDFLNEKGDARASDIFARPQSRYLVIDIGGGTLDATAHEILHGGNIKEIHKVTGGPHGGTKVDEQFVTLLGKVFGISVVEDFRMNYPAGWLKMMNDFEMKKRGKRASAGDTTRIVLPRDFITLVSNAGGLDLSGKFAKSCSLHDVKILNNEYLCLGSGAMKQLFQPVVNSIVGHLKELMQSPVLQGVNFFFLVGGFAESVILQEAIKREFSAKFRILLPLYASAAVMQGAVMFGQKPHIIDSRIMATTYGFDIYRHFDPNLHPIEKKHVIDDVTYCKDCFEVLAKENDVVKVGETKRFPDYRPLTGQQASARINLFTSKNPEVKYTTDTAVGPSIGKVVVDSPDTWKGINRRIDVCALFGGTEIKVTAVDLTSGNSATTYLDFLSRS